MPLDTLINLRYYLIMENNISFRLKNIIDKTGITAKELAKRIGVKPREINRWRDGLHQPHPVFKQKLLEILELLEDSI